MTVQQQAQHLATLAMSPGWREYVSHRIDELELCKSGAWRGIREAVNVAMRAAKEKQGTEK